MEFEILGEEENTTPDINSALDVTGDLPAEKAAKNIQNANIFDMDPDSYQDLSGELDDTASAVIKPSVDAGPVTSQYAMQSSQHTALVAPDIDKLSTMEKIVKNWYEDAIEEPELRRRENDIVSKQMLSEGKLSPDDQVQLDLIRSQREQRAQNTFGREVGFAERLFIDASSGLKDMAATYYENADLAAAVVGAGTALGTAAGFFLPVPGTTLVGAKVGAGMGLKAAAFIVPTVDGYKQASRSIYAELTKPDPNSPFKVDHARAEKISIAVGAMVAPLEGLGGGLLGLSRGITKKVISSSMVKNFITKSPATLAKAEIIGSMMVGASSEAITEFAQELSQSFGEELAKTEPTESGVQNAIDAFFNTWSEENLSTAAYSGLVGGIVGGGVAGGTSSPFYGKMTDRYEAIQTKVKEKQDTLKVQNVMLELAAQAKQTEMSKLAPQELNKVTGAILESMPSEFWFKTQDLQKIANDPEKGAKIRSFFEGNELVELAQKYGNSFSLPAADTLQLIMEYPEVSNAMRLSEAAESANEVRENAKRFTDSIKELEGFSDQFIQSLNEGAEVSPEFVKTLKKVQESSEGVISDRKSFHDRPLVSEVPGVIEGPQLETFNKAYTNARGTLDQFLVNEVNQKVDAERNSAFQTETEIEIATEIAALEKEHAIIRAYTKPETQDPTHRKKGYSVFAIDPRTLSEADRAIYFDENNLTPSIKKNMKDRKVFVEGGISVNEAAQLHGYINPTEFLKVLAETPTAEQIRTRRKKDAFKNETLKRKIAEETEQSRLDAIDEKFTDVSKLQLKELEIMSKQSHKTTKGRFVKIAKRPGTLKEYQSTAKAVSDSIKVKDVKPKVWESAERNKHNQAVTDYADGRFDQAFENKRDALLTNEIRKEQVKAEQKIRKDEAFWKNSKKKSFQETLKKAGLDKVFNSVVKMYGLDGSKKAEFDVEAFNNYTKTMRERGEFVPTVPDAFAFGQDSYRDLTTQEFRAITDFARTIHHQAKGINNLYKDYKNTKELMTAETIRERLAEHLRKNDKFDGKKIEKPSDTTEVESWLNTLNNAPNVFKSLKSMALELDNQEFNGYFYKTVIEPLVEARTAKRTEMRKIQKWEGDTIEKFYGSMDNFKDFMMEYVEVPEFKEFADIMNGNQVLKKSDLLVMVANLGDPDGRNNLLNYKKRDGTPISLDAIQNVLERHLTPNDVAFAQEFLVNRFKQFETRAKDLHKRTTGVEPSMIQGVPYVLHGREIPGGYFPQSYLPVPLHQKAADVQASLQEEQVKFFGAEDGKTFSVQRASEMTDTGRYKERQGSQRPLDLRIANIVGITEQIIHDLNFREPGIDTLKILKDPRNAENIQAVLGRNGFDTMLNHVRDSISKESESDRSLFKNENSWYAKGLERIHSMQAVKALAFNMKSAASQLDSINTLVMRTDAKTVMYVANAMKEVASNPFEYQKFVEIASMYNPDIKLEMDGVDHSIIKNRTEWMVNDKGFMKRWDKNAKNKYVKFVELQDKVVDAGFAPLRVMDQNIKVFAAVGVAQRFLNGDFPGFSAEQVRNMSPEERFNTAKSLVKQVSDSALTDSSPEGRSAIEKDKSTRWFVKFFTDRRSRLNTMFAQHDKIRGAAKRGDYSKASNYVLTTMLASGASAGLFALIKGSADSLVNKLSDAEDKEDLLEALGGSALDVAMSPFTEMTGLIPGADAVDYALSTKQGTRIRGVSAPAMSMISDVVVGGLNLAQYLESAVEDMEDGYTPEMSRKQRKNIVNFAGFAVSSVTGRGVPSNAINKALNLLGDLSDEDYISDSVAYMQDSIANSTKYIEENVPDSENFVQDVKDYAAQFPVQTEKSLEMIIPETSKETIKQVVSKGEWDSFNPDTGATGIYQFTEEQWDFISASDPELGLTEDGRYTQNTSEQEKAMDWLITYNTRVLIAQEVEVTEANLLGAHKFGADNFAILIQSDDNEKLSDLLGADASNPEFQGFETVGSIKRYLSREIKKVKP